MEGSLEGRFAILEKDPAAYPHACLGPVTCIRTEITKRALQFLSYNSI
jgi:hypothetical protein